jgi:CBS domain-containing protein
MLKSVNLRDYMLTNPIRVKPDDNIFEAMTVISDNKISGLCVVHPGEDIVDVAQDMLRQNKRRRPVVEDGKLIGQITIRHLLKAVRSFSESGGS